MRVCEAGPLQNVRPLCLDHHCGSLLAGLQRQHPHFYAVRFGLELGFGLVGLGLGLGYGYGSVIWSALRAPYGTTTNADPATDGRTQRASVRISKVSRSSKVTKIGGSVLFTRYIKRAQQHGSWRC